MIVEAVRQAVLRASVSSAPAPSANRKPALKLSPAPIVSNTFSRRALASQILPPEQADAPLLPVLATAIPPGASIAASSRSASSRLSFAARQHLGFVQQQDIAMLHPLARRLAQFRGPA